MCLISNEKERSIDMSELSINRYIDHAVLKPEMTQAEASQEIKVGVRYKVRTVCVRPADIKMAKDICRGSETEVSCVLSFPHGTALSESKAEEAKRYVGLRVSEIDMVVNYGLILSGEWNRVKRDIAAVVGVTKPAGVVLKVILETSALKAEHITRATETAIEVGADFVKTSTGFGSGGATDEAVKAMLLAANGRIGVKASGGLRDFQRAKYLVDMGCMRLGVGSASTPAICDGSKAAGGLEGY